MGLVLGPLALFDVLGFIPHQRQTPPSADSTLYPPYDTVVNVVKLEWFRPSW